LSDLLEALRKYAMVIALAAAAAVLVAVAIGVLIGLTRRQSSPGVLGEVRSGRQAAQSAQTGSSTENRASDVLVPGPIRPLLAEEEDSALLYFDRHPEFIDTIEPLSVGLSDLIEQRRRGVQSEVKPFIFMGEELDILTLENELAEP
jgi:hypothetical protein